MKSRVHGMQILSEFKNYCLLGIVLHTNEKSFNSSGIQSRRELQFAIRHNLTNDFKSNPKMNLLYSNRIF